MTNSTKVGEAAGKVVGATARNPLGCSLAVLDVTGVAYILAHLSTIWHLLDRLFGL